MKYQSDEFAGDGAHSVDATDVGTRVTYRFDGSPKNPFFNLLIPLMKMRINRTAKKNYAKLKGILESNV